MTHTPFSVSSSASSTSNSSFQPCFGKIWLCPAGVCLPCPQRGDRVVRRAVGDLSLSLDQGLHKTSAWPRAPCGCEGEDAQDDG